jgi:DNA repair protein RecO (recombination protein O)
MRTETEGIVISQVKTLNGRRMVNLFSRELGKIGAGAYASGGKGRSPLALKPFVHGRYEISKTPGGCSINRAEVVRSHYGIAGDVDRFARCAYALEFTGKLLPEEYPAPKLFALALEFFDFMLGRDRGFDAPMLAYIFKAMKLMGAAPEFDGCRVCGGRLSEACSFSVADGGAVCAECASKIANCKNSRNVTLIYPINFGIVSVVEYLIEHPLKDLERLSLDSRTAAALRRVAKDHAEYHLDLGRMKAEGLIGLGDKP